MKIGYGFDRTIADRWSRNGALLLAGVIGVASVAGSTVTIYEGNDPSSGHVIATLTLPANQSHALMFTAPLLCDRGVYLDIGANVSEVTIIYAPVAEDPPGDPITLMRY